MAAPPIISAARGADVETLRRLLAEGVSPDEITWGFGRTPLHWLCNPDTFNPVISVSPSEVSDFVTCFKLLREAGANLEAVDGWGYTPLQCAAYSEFPELLSLLVQKPALIWMRHSRLVPQRCTSQHAMGLSIASKCSWPQALL